MAKRNAFSVRSGTLKKYINDASLRLSQADRSFLDDLTRVRIIDGNDASFHYANRKTSADKRLDRLVDAGLLSVREIYQPKRGTFKAYEFKNQKVASLFGGKLPTIGAKRNALHEVITSKIYFAEGRPTTFKLEADLSKEERNSFTSKVDGKSHLPDAIYQDSSGALVVCEADSGQYTASQIASKQAGWAGIKQVWGQPQLSAGRVQNATVHRFG